MLINKDITYPPLPPPLATTQLRPMFGAMFSCESLNLLVDETKPQLHWVAAWWQRVDRRCARNANFA